ncbi:uncharacterized protein BJX67DRAFT_387638 [Aspergillus lucknowensis]|uniref:DUF7600 domain-containing protein n=1 Tax=Aspergillus lucknowensis TaxID=176173 RepID=A0ABR4LT64_9EURO
MLHYCVMCGVLIRRTSAAPGTVPIDLEWHQELRVVQLRNDSPDSTSSETQLATLSGVGFVDLLDRIVAPLDHRCRYKDNGVSLVSSMAFYDTEHATWRFSFHDLCWEILLQRIPEGPSDVNNFSTLFFQSLFCTTWAKARHIRPDHDFGGASQFQALVGNPIRNMIDREILSSLPQPTQTSRQGSAHLMVRDPYSRNDIFASLPAEVLLLIFFHLHSGDIQQVRLASRYVASRTDPTVLPQSFWRSRYRADFEMGFASPIRTVRNQNWRDGYFALKDVLSDNSNSLFPRASNRRRIWRLAGINATLFALHMAGITLHGRPYTEIMLVAPGIEMLDASAGKMVSADLFEDRHQLLPSGNRKLHDRVVILPLDESVIKSIRIFTVLFNSQQFISGLLFQLVNPSTKALTDISLGYMSSSPSHLVEIALSIRALGFELAICALGVTGVRVLVAGNGYCGPEPPWVGDTGSEKADCAFGRLTFGQQEAQRVQIVASIDAFKIVAFGIIEGSTSAAGMAHQWPAQAMWMPSYPRETVSLVPQPQPKFHHFNPVLNVNFGGPHGEMIPRLTRIVTHLLDIRAPIVGLSFYRDDQSHIHFGKQGSMEVSSFIDGPGGEVISGAIVEMLDARVILIRMRTNLGREFSLGCHEMVGEYRPLQDSNPFLQPEQRAVETLEPPIQQHITGFTATLEASAADNSSFDTFGLQCERSQWPSKAMIKDKAYTNEALISVRLASSLGSYLICEKANNRRPRRSSEVSGLWFDYYGSSSSSIAGQWIFEGSSMNVEREEIITGITIWLSNGRKSFSEKYCMGRVLRISVSTSLQTVSYPNDTPLPLHEHTVLRFQENYLEGLSFLVWPWDPYHFFESRPWTAPELGLWAGVTQADPLASVTGYHGRSNKDNITGLRFTYVSGASQDIGDVFVDRSCGPVRLDPGEDVRKISLITDGRGLRERNLPILWTDWTNPLLTKRHQFHTNNGCNSEDARHAIANTSAPPTSGGVDCLEVDLLHRRYTWLYYLNIQAVGQIRDSGSIPDGEFAGIWGFTMPDENLVMGVVLLADS